MRISKKAREFWHSPLAGFDFWRDAGTAKFYPRLADWAINFFELELTLTNGEWRGLPFLLQPWQKQLVGHLFGWLRPDGTRRFRKLFLYVPRKNGKTELAAGLGLIFFVADNEPGAEVYNGALTITQAKILRNKIRTMIRSNPYLSERLSVPKGQHNTTISDPDTESILQVLAANEESTQGFNAHCAIVDELHTLPDGGFPGALAESMGTRRQPMMIEITTAADAGDNYCNQELDYAEQVRDGRVSDPELMPIIFRATDKDDPSDPAVWRKCNPSIGTTIKESFYHQQYKRMSKTAIGLARFKKYFLNLPTLQNKAWIDVEFWNACKADFPLSEMENKRCYMAIDRSNVSDISAIGLFFPDEMAYHCEFIVPRETAENNIAYSQWAKSGLIRISEFSAIRDDELFELAADLKQRYNVVGMLYDPWRMASLAEWISKRPMRPGYDDGKDPHGFGLGIPSVPVAQSYKELTGIVSAVEIAVKNKTLRHFGNPVLQWMIQNARTESDSKENVKIVKESKGSPKKIDGVITLLMSYKPVIVKDLFQVSVYETLGGLRE